MFGFGAAVAAGANQQQDDVPETPEQRIFLAVYKASSADEVRAAVAAFRSESNESLLSVRDQGRTLLQAVLMPIQQDDATERAECLQELLTQVEGEKSCTKAEMAAWVAHGNFKKPTDRDLNNVQVTLHGVSNGGVLSETAANLPPALLLAALTQPTSPLSVMRLLLPYGRHDVLRSFFNNSIVHFALFPFMCCVLADWDQPEHAEHSVCTSVLEAMSAAAAALFVDALSAQNAPSFSSCPPSLDFFEGMHTLDDLAAHCVQQQQQQQRMTQQETATRHADIVRRLAVLLWRFAAQLEQRMSAYPFDFHAVSEQVKLPKQLSGQHFDSMAELRTAVNACLPNPSSGLFANTSNYVADQLKHMDHESAVRNVRLLVLKSLVPKVDTDPTEVTLHDTACDMQTPIVPIDFASVEGTLADMFDLDNITSSADDKLASQLALRALHQNNAHVLLLLSKAGHSVLDLDTSLWYNICGSPTCPLTVANFDALVQVSIKSANNKSSQFAEYLSVTSVLHTVARCCTPTFVRNFATRLRMHGVTLDWNNCHSDLGQFKDSTPLAQTLYNVQGHSAFQSAMESVFDLSDPSVITDDSIPQVDADLNALRSTTRAVCVARILHREGARFRAKNAAGVPAIFQTMVHLEDVHLMYNNKRSMRDSECPTASLLRNIWVHLTPMLREEYGVDLLDMQLCTDRIEIDINAERRRLFERYNDAIANNNNQAAQPQQFGLFRQHPQVPLPDVAFDIDAELEHVEQRSEVPFEDAKFDLWRQDARACVQAVFSQECADSRRSVPVLPTHWCVTMNQPRLLRLLLPLFGHKETPLNVSPLSATLACVSPRVSDMTRLVTLLLRNGAQLDESSSCFDAEPDETQPFLSRWLSDYLPRLQFERETVVVNVACAPVSSWDTDADKIITFSAHAVAHSLRAILETQSKAKQEELVRRTPVSIKTALSPIVGTFTYNHTRCSVSPLAAALSLPFFERATGFGHQVNTSFRAAWSRALAQVLIEAGAPVSDARAFVCITGHSDFLNKDASKTASKEMQQFATIECVSGVEAPNGGLFGRPAPLIPEGRINEDAVSSVMLLLANGFDPRCLEDESVVGCHEETPVVQMPVVVQTLESCTEVLRAHVTNLARQLSSCVMFARAPQELQAVIVGYLVENKALQVDERFVFGELARVGRPARIQATMKLMRRTLAESDLTLEEMKHRLNQLLSMAENEISALVDETLF
ncbi:MAG: hypothetical protein MHM6MM_001330 [Cercozoa sp. M6MM]